jgi:predicted transcriptional regulator
MSNRKQRRILNMDSFNTEELKIRYAMAIEEQQGIHGETNGIIIATFDVLSFAIEMLEDRIITLEEDVRKLKEAKQ